MTNSCSIESFEYRWNVIKSPCCTVIVTLFEMLLGVHPQPAGLARFAYSGMDRLRAAASPTAGEARADDAATVERLSTNTVAKIIVE